MKHFFSLSASGESDGMVLRLPIKDNLHYRNKFISAHVRTTTNRGCAAGEKNSCSACLRTDKLIELPFAAFRNLPGLLKAM